MIRKDVCTKVGERFLDDAKDWKMSPLEFQFVCAKLLTASVLATEEIMKKISEEEKKKVRG